MNCMYACIAIMASTKERARERLRVAQERYEALSERLLDRYMEGWLPWPPSAFDFGSMKYEYEQRERQEGEVEARAPKSLPPPPPPP